MPGMGLLIDGAMQQAAQPDTRRAGCCCCTRQRLPVGLCSLLHGAVNQQPHPRHAEGKPAGVTCVPLDAQWHCKL